MNYKISGYIDDRLGVIDLAKDKKSGVQKWTS